MPLKPYVVCQFDGYTTAYPAKKVRAGPYLKQWHYVYAEEGNADVGARFARVQSLDQCVDADCFQHGLGFDSLVEFLALRGIQVSQDWRGEAQKEIDRRKAMEKGSMVLDPQDQSGSLTSE